MKVLHVFNALEFSGAEVMYVQAAPIFKEKGCELIALSTAKELGSYASNFEKSGYKIEHKPLILSLKNILTFLSTLVWLYNYIKDEKVDVVHIHRSVNYWWVALFARLAGAGVVRTIHNVFKNRWFTRPKAIIERWSARILLKVVFHSIGESVYQNEQGYYKNQTSKVNNWFDNTRFFPVINKQEKTKIRAELGLADELVVISVGGCSYVKRHEDILEAVSVISKIRPITYLHLGDGITRCAEEHKAAELNITDNVIFVGKTNEVRKYLIASDIYLMPSRFEGLSIATIETMACGLPSVLYDVPGLRDLVHQDDTGLLIPENVPELVKAITYLDNDEAARCVKGEKATEVANDSFNITNGVEGIYTIYTSIKS